MQGLSANYLILEEAKSAELQAAFQLVCQAETDHVEKFTQSTTRQLARDITCRNYAPVIHELCHLIVIADGCGVGADRYEQYFWGSGPARRENFARYVRDITGNGSNWRVGGFSLFAEGVETTYSDGKYNSSFARMPLLSAMMEFLLTTLEYESVDNIIERMLDEDRTMQAVSETAKELSRLVYAYLSDHLPSAQNQRKFRRLIDYLQGHLGETFDAHDIDDPAILDFWVAETADPELAAMDFRTFLSVFRAFTRLIQSLEQARSKLGIDSAIPIGNDRDAGEIDPAILVDAFDTIHDQTDPLTRLDQSPLDRVKFMNKQEMKNLELLSQCGSTANQVPLSVMRAEVFGDAQSRISQALRKKMPEDELTDLLQDAASEDYDARRLRFEKLKDHIERTLLASFFSLVRNRRREAISVLLKLRPDIDLSGVAEHLTSFQDDGDNVVSLTASSVSDHFMALLEDPDQAGPELAGLMADAHASYRSLSRKGFTDADAEDEENLGVFEAGADILSQLKVTLQNFTDRLGQMVLEGEDWRDQYQLDRQIFGQQFKKLYGDH